MSDKNLTQKIIEKIEQHKLKPKPKWEFILKEYFVWALATISLIIGSLGFAVVIYMIKNNDWDLYDRVSPSLFSFVFASLPYFWIILLAIFILLVYYIFRQTKAGYKHRIVLIFIFSIVLSILLGTIFYSTGLGAKLERQFDERLPIYRRLMDTRMRMWDRPKDSGILAGRILNILNQQELNLEDLHNRHWIVIYNQEIYPLI